MLLCMHHCPALDAFCRHDVSNSAKGQPLGCICVRTAHLLDQVFLRLQAPSDDGVSNGQLVL